MAALLIGYARCSSDGQDLVVQRSGLAALGVTPDRIYVDHGLTGTNREQSGLREALAACRDHDTLVVTKLDCLAGSVPDARSIADELTARRVRLSLGAAVCDPTDPAGRLLSNVLAKVTEFESDLIRLRTREGRRSPRPGASLARWGCDIQAHQRTSSRIGPRPPWACRPPSDTTVRSRGERPVIPSADPIGRPGRPGRGRRLRRFAIQTAHLGRGIGGRVGCGVPAGRSG